MQQGASSLSLSAGPPDQVGASCQDRPWGSAADSRLPAPPASTRSARPDQRVPRALTSRTCSPLAWLATSAGWFYLVQILASVANTCIWTIMMATALQYGSDEERPLYVGMATTLSTPATILAPLAAGWLANAFGYPISFAASAFFGVCALIVFHFFVRDPRRTPAAAPQA